MTDILQIEMRRKALGVSKGQLCRTADINRSTYTRLNNVRGSGNASTFQKLAAALDALASVKDWRS